MNLWTSAEVEQALGVFGLPSFVANGISIDTRTLQKGDVFIALMGESDGHAYVADAAAKGAAAVIVSKMIKGCNAPQVMVPDTQKALEQLGKYARSRAVHMKAIAITGSSGKTSTKEMLATALKAHRSVASYNNHFGVPLTLARTPADTAFGVYELGMNHAGEIAPLAKQIQPHVALITNVGTAHLGNLGSKEQIRQEKLSVAKGLPKNGLLIVPEGLDVSGVREDIRILRFGGKKSDAVAREAMPQGDGWKVWADIDGEQVVFDVHHPGAHQVTNALAALLAAKSVGQDVTEAALRLGRAEAVTGRGKIYHLDDVTVIDDSYNANPESVRAALYTLLQRPAARRVAVLGDMLELGAESASYHKDLVAACEGVDVVVTVGAESRALQEALPLHQRGGHFATQDQVELILHAGDTLLVKGSNGIGLSKLVDRLTHHQNGTTKHAV